MATKRTTDRCLWTFRFLCPTEHRKTDDMFFAWLPVLHKVSQYNNEREKYWHRWIGNLPNIDIPTHILWAQQDPIAVKEIAEKLHSEIPNSVYTKIDKCGHYPMLEQPEIWANLMKEFLMKHL